MILMEVAEVQMYNENEEAIWFIIDKEGKIIEMN